MRIIQICTRQVLRLPNSAIIRKVGMQGDNIVSWFASDYPKEIGMAIRLKESLTYVDQCKRS